MVMTKLRDILFTRKILFLVLLCIIACIFFAIYKYYEGTDFSKNPYIFYERSITARIGAYAPYAFMDKGGTLDGYVMDLTYAISRVMGVRVVLLSRRLDSPTELAKKHDADVVLCMVKTPVTSKEYDFTAPYATHTFSIFARKEAPPPDMDYIAQGEAWVVNEDGVYHELYGERHDCPLSGTAEEALHDIAQGRRMYTIMETYIGKKLIEEQALDNVAFLQETNISVEYAYAIRKGNPNIFDIFSNGLKYLHSSGQFNKIQHKWLEKRFLLTKRNLEQFFVYAAIALTIILLSAVAMLIWSHVLKEQVRRRTAELKQEINERRKAESRLRQSQAQLVQADKMAAVGTLASGIAHEINNPNGLLLLNLVFIQDILRDIRPYLDTHFEKEGNFMIAGMPWPQLRDTLDSMMEDSIQASGHIRDIVDDLKEFVRKSGDSPSELFQLNDALEHSLRLVRNMIKKSTSRFQMRTGRDMPAVKGSPRKIGQVLINLIINACQALEHPAQGLLLETGTSSDGRSVFFRLTDEGCGISAEDLPCICDPFFTTKRAHGGTGLGLSVSSSIVEGYGGSLSFISEPGQGTTVTLTLPAHRPQDTRHD